MAVIVPNITAYCRRTYAQCSCGLENGNIGLSDGTSGPGLVGLTTTRTIFRGGTAKQNAKKGKAPAAKSGGSKSRSGAGKEPVRKTNRKAKEKKSNSLLVPILILILVVVCGVAGLLALQLMGVQK